ncbi:MAG: alkyl sulfatase dimerization domain-containing protein [Myxococcota bacterium]
MQSARALLCALLTALCGCEDRESVPAFLEGSVHPTLLAHTAEFERKVYEVTEGVHLAVGYGLANSILVEGDACAFVVDVMGSVPAARAVKQAFDEITDKPIRALVYTHNHADHVFGGRGFVPDGPVDVYAHETTEYYINRVVSIIRPIISLRSSRMFGNYLPPEGADAFVNAGIGPALEIGGPGQTLSLIRPNKTFSDELRVAICGVDVHLVHAPGETNDQLFVWLPEKKLLMPGDNVYRAFPNLYTIRGTLYRDVMDWVRSIDSMRALHPEHLAPSHTRPVSGAERIQEILTAYRDAIQYVHDQTIRGMNMGLTPDELVEFVELPPHLRDHPYLLELYGTVEWSVRSIFTGYLGWFDGDAASLSPANPEERARGFAQLAGGRDALLTAARSALDERRYAWAAELAGQLLRLDPNSNEVRELKASALRALGERSVSPNGRNFYLTQARELEGSVSIDPGEGVDESVRSVAMSIPIGNFMAAMPSHLDPRRSADADTVVGFRFPDVQESYSIHVRRGVAELQPVFPEQPDVAITTDSGVWREVVLGLRNPALALASGAIEIDGGALDLVAFLSWFSE